ncbi:MAG TPA: biopolymer transporter ExbD [Kiritimatiellia bacterium]|nr:biopolymer transporter ExbD [Kiritimatiellia bacterium]HMO99654.1 biopolymer transporter ExbD [Kiritimatiellia bacterium]HMP96172.1 biopolymer transporter ExbD [Kiritimatiellia bacterium]
MKFRARPRPESPGFQMTPMIDVVFLLLCFFVTSQLFAQWETEIDITLPTARTGQLPQRLPGEIILNLYEDGKVVINRREVAPAELGVMLQRLAGLFPGQPVLLRADQATPYEHVIAVLDLCRQADIWNISFATGVPEER